MSTFRVSALLIASILMFAAGTGCRSDATLPAGRPAFDANRVVCCEIDNVIDGDRYGFGSIGNNGVVTFTHADGSKYQTKLPKGQGISYTQLKPGTYTGVHLTFTRNYVGVHPTANFDLPYQFVVPTDAPGVYVGTIRCESNKHGTEYTFAKSSVSAVPATFEQFKKDFPKIADKAVQSIVTPKTAVPAR